MSQPQPALVHFVEHIGPRVIRVGTCYAAGAVPPSAPGATVVPVSLSDAGVALPARWDATARRAVPLPPQPSPQYDPDYETGSWRLNPERAWAAVRAERDRLIAATDWRVVRAQEAGEPLDPAWVRYRQALRDITDQPDPESLAWPEPPG